jgi:hypothetical protein
MRVVAGAKEEAIFNLNKRISESVLKASSRDPLSTVLIAEVALSFGACILLYLLLGTMLLLLVISPWPQEKRLIDKYAWPQ